MTIIFKECSSRLQAQRIAARIDEAAGYPRCTHPKHRLVNRAAALKKLDREVRRRGRVAACTCASATEVDAGCPYVTWREAVVIEVDGKVYVQAPSDRLGADEEGRALRERELNPSQRERAEVAER